MTDAPPAIPEVLHEAAKIFLTELKEHAEFFKAAASDLKSNAMAIMERFHLIKGGAGFLKLKALREAASAGEKVFRVPALDLNAARASLDAAMPVVEQAIAELSEQLK